MGENRTLLKLDEPLAVFSLHQNIGADDIGGHEVRRKLDAGCVELHNVAQALDQVRFSEPGYSFQQSVPVAEQAHQHPFDYIFVAHDSLVNFALDRQYVPCPICNFAL